MSNPYFIVRLFNFGQFWKVALPSLQVPFNFIFVSLKTFSVNSSLFLASLTAAVAVARIVDSSFSDKSAKFFKESEILILQTLIK